MIKIKSRQEMTTGEKPFIELKKLGAAQEGSLG
jgi:hypothetical protein